MNLKAALLAVALLLSGCNTSHSDHKTPAATPTDISAEAGFVRDMSVHHNQAVAMAEAIRPRTQDPELRLLATDIALGQQNQIGRMTGWLDQWGLSITSTNEPMAWIDDHQGMTMNSISATADGLMPGMATRPQISALSTLALNDAEISFLQLMIVHHRAGVEMAKAIIERTSRPEVLAMANSIVTSQQSDVTVMTEMLAKRGATP